MNSDIGNLNLLITGATGFIGSALVDRLLKDGVNVSAGIRSGKDYESLPPKIRRVQTDLPLNTAGYTGPLKGVDVLIHLAGRAHVRPDSFVNPLQEFRKANVHHTEKLAIQAANSGVKRFIFISSVGVNGAESFRHPFTSEDMPAPHSPYSVSKYEAEKVLKTVAAKTGMEVVIIRPPLVYGPNAPGNFGVLMKWLYLGIPLPFGSICNQRSFVALDNLIDLILICITHRNAVNQTFLVSDGEDVSTTELLCRMALAIKSPTLLIPVPSSLIKFTAVLLGRRYLAQGLLGSLQVDIEKTRSVLGWTPPLTLDQGLKKAAQGRIA